MIDYELSKMKEALENEIIRVSTELTNYEGTDETVFSDYGGQLKGLSFAIKYIDNKL